MSQNLLLKTLVMKLKYKNFEKRSQENYVK